MSEHHESLKEAVQRPLSLWQTIRAVAWSFLGVRQSAAYDQDVQRLNPLHVIVAGVLGALLFILALWATVRWVVSSGVAS
jgi:hypothetical protein